MDFVQRTYGPCRDGHQILVNCVVVVGVQATCRATGNEDVGNAANCPKMGYEGVIHALTHS